MTEQVTEQLRRLAGTLADLQGRVRTAVAGEVGRAVADAVGEVLAAALGGRAGGRPGWAGAHAGRDSYGRPAGGYGPAGWDDPDDPGWDPDFARLRRAGDHSNPADGPAPGADPVGPAAL